MRTQKIFFFFAFSLFIVSCGNSETTSSNENSEVMADKEVNIESSVEQNEKMEYAEKEMIEESKSENSSSKNELPQTAEVKNIPKAVKTSQVINNEKPSKEVITPVNLDEEGAEQELGYAKEDVNIEVKEPSSEAISEEVPEVKEETLKEPVLSHDTFDQLLRKYVSSSGKVNYKAFKADEAKLDAYLKLLENNPPKSDWSQSKKMAFWINAYNAATIKLILKNYPVSSITKLHGGKPWDVKWIKIGDKRYTLNNIENDILRPKYKDARIHFAVNCAAKSCPPLLNRAWTAGNLESNLEKQTRSFIQNSSQNSISKNTVTISKIFEWYAVDFGNIIDFLNKYSSTTINAGAKVTYKEYDWNLNN